MNNQFNCNDCSQSLQVVLEQIKELKTVLKNLVTENALLKQQLEWRSFDKEIKKPLPNKKNGF